MEFAHPHAVYIVGGNPAGSGWYTDGTGITSGPRNIITDSTSTTAAAAAVIAQNYFTQQITQFRGSFSLNAFVPPTTWHAGSLVQITDALAGLSGQTFRIASITKTFNPGGTQNWRVQFGGLAPSSLALLRRWTRAVT
jgi:hypothetical protein